MDVSWQRTRDRGNERERETEKEREGERWREIYNKEALYSQFNSVDIDLAQSKSNMEYINLLFHELV